MSKFRICLAAVCGFLNPFGSVFESVTDYVLSVLNDYLAKDGVAENIRQSREISEKILKVLRDYASYCPSRWFLPYCETITAVASVVAAFEDGKIDKEEIARCTDAFKKTYAAWMAD